MLRSLVSLIMFWTVIQWAAMLVFRSRRELAAAGRPHFIVTQGGAELRPALNDMKDAVVSVLQGGIVLDLRGLPRENGEPLKLDVFIIMGGLELLVPEDWNVRLNVQPMMGGVRDRRTGSRNAERELDLMVQGQAIMGGVEVASERRQMAARRHEPLPAT
jgi:hypothetical protein